MYQCKKCGREFKERRYLEQHKRRKTPCGNDLQCKKCFKVFPNTHKLKRHMDRKTPCAPEEIPVIPEDNPDNRCQFCNRTYSTKSNLKRHLKTCDKDKNMQAMVRLMMEQNAQQNEKIEQLTNAMETMSKQLVVPNQTNVFNDNRSLNINFVNFPLQDMSAVDMQKVLQIASSQPTNQIIPAIVEHLHGNPKYPENQNIFMARMDAEVTIVFGGDGEKTWHTIPRQTAFSHLRTEAMGILTHRDKPMTNFKLLEAAHDVGHRDTKYQEKIAELAINDPTDDEVLAQKLVDFGDAFHKNKKAEFENIEI